MDEKEEIVQELKEIKKLLQVIVSNQEQRRIFFGENCAQIQVELSEH